MIAVASPALPLPRPARDGGAGLPVSIGLHAVVVAMLVAAAPRLAPPPAEPVAVEMVTEETYRALTRPADPPPPGVRPALPGAMRAAPPAAAADGPLPAQTRPVPFPTAPGALVPARRLLSAGILAAPRSRKTREQLARLAPDTRREQLCNLEAMAQVTALQAGIEADRVLAYAMAPVRLAGDAVVATGAAVHSPHRWTRLSFTCHVDPAGARVTGFAFALGDAIPRREWEAHDLTDERTTAD